MMMLMMMAVILATMILRELGGEEDAFRWSKDINLNPKCLVNGLCYDVCIYMKEGNRNERIG